MFSKIGANYYRRTDVKLTLWYILTFILSASIICGFLYFRLKHKLIEEVDRFLLDEIKELGEILAINPYDKNVLVNFENHMQTRVLYPVYFRILMKNGDHFYNSNKFKKIGYKPDERVWIKVQNSKEIRENVPSIGERPSYRVITTFLQVHNNSGYILQVGTHLTFVRKSLSNFKNNILITLPILVLLGSLGGWFLARKSLSPIGYIVSRTQNITSENLSERLIPRGTGDEMDDLIQTINGMVARLDASFKQMAEFTADASHELKTPICAMRGEAEVLLSRERSVEEYQEALVHLVEAFDRMNQMLNDLIFLSKSDSTQVELNMSPLRLDDLLKDACGLFQVLAELKNISLTAISQQEVVIMGDKMRLQQLFTNLIENAIKYTQEGSILITIEKDGETAFVKVSDTGSGIPKEEQENIFKRFYRVDKSRSKDTGGAGLGLSIASWIAHAHHGRIEVESESGRGSTFKVSLPLS